MMNKLTHQHEIEGGGGGKLVVVAPPPRTRLKRPRSAFGPFLQSIQPYSSSSNAHIACPSSTSSSSSLCSSHHYHPTTTTTSKKSGGQRLVNNQPPQLFTRVHMATPPPSQPQRCCSPTNNNRLVANPTASLILSSIAGGPTRSRANMFLMRPRYLLLPGIFLYYLRCG